MMIFHRYYKFYIFITTTKNYAKKCLNEKFTTTNSYKQQQLVVIDNSSIDTQENVIQNYFCTKNILNRIFLVNFKLKIRCITTTGRKINQKNYENYFQKTKNG